MLIYRYNTRFPRSHHGPLRPTQPLENPTRRCSPLPIDALSPGVVITATGDTHPPSVSSSSTTTTSSSSPSSPSSAGRSGLAARAATVAVGFGVDDPVPASREEKAKLVGGYLGTSRPGYGNEALKREWWPAEVPWLKGMSISQVST